MVWERIVFTYGIIVISFAIGFFTVYGLSERTKKERKEQIDQVMTILINFVLYIWLSKLLFNIQVVLQDPIAALAFPSDSRSFYLAHVFVAIHQLVRRQLLPPMLFPIVFVSSFVYEFIQVVLLDNFSSFYYFIVLGVMLIGALLLKNKIEISNLVKMIVLVWVCALFLLSIVSSSFVVFGYTIQPEYPAILLIITIVWIFRNKK